MALGGVGKRWQISRGWVGSPTAPQGRVGASLVPGWEERMRRRPWYGRRWRAKEDLAVAGSARWDEKAVVQAPLSLHGRRGRQGPA